MPGFLYSYALSALPPELIVNVEAIRSSRSKMAAGGLVARIDTSADYSRIPAFVFAQLRPWAPVGVLSGSSIYDADIKISGFSHYFPIRVMEDPQPRDRRVVVLGRDFLNDFLMTLGMKLPSANSFDLWFGMAYDG